MAIRKTLEQLAPLIALLAVIATFALVAWSVESVQRGGHPHVSELAAVGAQSTEMVEAREEVFGISAEGWIAIFTVVLAIATCGLIWATLRLGERADRGLRELERAYIYPVFNDENPPEGPAQRLDQILNSAPGEMRGLSLPFLLTNLGKTPGTILSVVADIRYRGVPFDVARHYVTQPILGEGKSSNQLIARGQITPEQAAVILGFGEESEANTPLIFNGYVNYVDIFGKEHHEPFAWPYVRKARRFVPIIQPHQKPKSIVGRH